jgi:hypothetical protein
VWLTGSISACNSFASISSFRWTAMRDDKLRPPLTALPAEILVARLSIRIIVVVAMPLHIALPLPPATPTNKSRSA